MRLEILTLENGYLLVGPLGRSTYFATASELADEVEARLKAWDECERLAESRKITS